jgi:hypothetical protein
MIVATRWIYIVRHGNTPETQLEYPEYTWDRLTIEDVRLIQSILPTKDEVYDYARANNRYKPEDSKGNEVTDWIEAVVAAGDDVEEDCVDFFRGRLDEIIYAKRNSRTYNYNHNRNHNRNHKYND